MLLSSYDEIEVVGEAAEGRQAVEMMEACQPHVILMDTIMPGMSGEQIEPHSLGSWSVFKSRPLFYSVVYAPSPGWRSAIHQRI